MFSAVPLQVMPELLPQGDTQMAKCQGRRSRRRQWHFSVPRYSSKIFLLYHSAWAEPKTILWNVHQSTAEFF